MERSPYLDLFLSEAGEHVASASKLAPRLADSSAFPKVVQELFRHAHSLKGMAATMDCRSLTRLAHATEDLLQTLRSGELPPEDLHVELLLDDFACMERLLDALQRGEAPDDGAVGGLTARLRGAARLPAAPAGEAPVSSDSISPPPQDAHASWRIDLELAGKGAELLKNVELVLERLRELGSIVHGSAPPGSLTGEEKAGRITLLLSTDRTRSEIEETLRRTGKVCAVIVASEPSTPPSTVPVTESSASRWVRVRADLLDRALDDARELRIAQKRLAATIRPSLSVTARSQLERTHHLLRDLEARLVELRLLPFDTISMRMSRTVRDLARSLGKRVRFEIAGADIRMDRAVLEALLDPLTHLLRNALDHGIEEPGERIACGKHPEGLVRILLEQRGERSVVVVEDDGRGFDLGAIRKTAVERGFVSRGAAARLDADELRMLVTLPGFTTARGVGEVSGRGVGMDVVRAQVESIGGALRLGSEAGRGSRVTLSLPLSRSAMQGLLFRCGGELYAIPVALLERTLDLRDEPLLEGRATTCPSGEGSPVPLVRLRERLRPSSRPGSDEEGGTVLLCPTRDGTIGLLVDEVVGRRELLVQPLDGSLRFPPEFAGAAVLEDGSVALVMDPWALAPD